MSKCFCHFNGYEVKDAQARRDIETLNNNLNTTNLSVSTNKSNIDLNKTDIEELKNRKFKLSYDSDKKELNFIFNEELIILEGNE